MRPVTAQRRAPLDARGRAAASDRRTARLDPELSAIEWLVVELARHDRIDSLRPATRWDAWKRRLFGLEPVNRLADPRLESLRRVAVSGWRLGKIADEEVDRFLAQGFTFDQLMLVVRMIEARRG